MSALYPSDGRVRGHYLYALICGDGEAIYIKIGISIDPLARLDGLRTACPLTPDTMATVCLVNRRQAMQAEMEIHKKLAPWRSNGEWFKFTLADKEAFNLICREILKRFEKPSWPLKWTKLSLAPLLA